MPTANDIWEKQNIIEKLKAEKKAGNDLQMRKHTDWNENYELYRNKVKTNRLTQRQAVNIPLMKETVKTMLSKIDEPPICDWKELGGDEDKELLYQEIWDSNFRDGKLELIDIKDKKNVLLYGIGTKKLNITPEGVIIDSLDVYDVVFDPMMAVANIESARFIVHKNIFRSLREILADDRYTTEGKSKLKIWVESPKGITQSNDNKEQYEKRMERLKDMGVSHSDFPLFAGGDRIVNLTEHYSNMWNTATQKWERRVYVYADDEVILLDDTLMSLIGIDLWPFTIWVEDPETTDIYSDAVADLVRTPNKIINVWFSQLIENRTLKNFQMHWFAPVQGFTPQTYTPGPGVMLPAPPLQPGQGISDVIKPVEISGLDDTFEAIQILTQIVERGTGTVALEKGQPEKGTQTLGEVEILVGKAMERAVSMAVFYRMSWYETCVKWDALMQANAPKIMKLYKQGRSGKMYMKKVYASDWTSTAGYRPQIISTSEREQEGIKTLQKFQFALAQFPTNIALRKIGQKRILESLDLSPDELKQIEDAEDETSSKGGEALPVAGDEEMVQGIEQSLGELQNLRV